MKTCLLIVGHNAEAGDRGAISPNGVTEWEYNHDLIGIVPHGVTGVNFVLEHYRAGGGNVARFNRYGADLAIELHCNSFSNPAATGTEVLCAKGIPRRLEQAQLIASHIAGALELPLRGVAGAVEIGNAPGPLAGFAERGAYLIWGLRSPAFIVEPFFISNPKDFQRANGDKIEYAHALGDAIEELLTQ